MNKEEMERCSCTFLIAVANSDATESTFILLDSLRKGIVSQTTSSFITEFSIDS